MKKKNEIKNEKYIDRYKEEKKKQDRYKDKQEK